MGGEGQVEKKVEGWQVGQVSEGDLGQVLTQHSLGFLSMEPERASL